MNLETQNSFGPIAQFNTFDLEIVKRNNFAVVPQHLKISVDKDISILNDPKNIRISNHYYADSFIDFPLHTNNVFSAKKLIFGTVELTGPPESFAQIAANIVTWEDEQIRLSQHAFSNDEVYRNLQRLCLEILDPLFLLLGERVEIKEGVIFRESVGGVAGDSFFLEQAKGNAVVFGLKNDTNNTKLNKCRDFIKEFSLFDQMFLDYSSRLYDQSTIAVSVNDKKRNQIFKRYK